MLGLEEVGALGMSGVLRTRRSALLCLFAADRVFQWIGAAGERLYPRHHVW